MSVLEPGPNPGNYETVFQPWSAPLTGVIEGPVQYGDGDGGNLDGCAPFSADSLADNLVIVVRGGCDFSEKARNIQEAGGVLGIIGLIGPGSPFAGVFGGGSPLTIPSFMVSQSTADILRAGSAVVCFDPNNVLSQVGSTTDTSSRGPELGEHRIKPKIAAPGASVSAVAGTGDGQAPFGGTSGAAPMVSGSAALVLQAYSTLPGENLSPLEVKALLMNNAETQVFNEAGGSLAPISRIGGGEVRVDRAVAAPAAAWDEDHPTGALSFGFLDVADATVPSASRCVSVTILMRISPIR
jgi:subtilisin family serine protease